MKLFELLLGVRRNTHPSGGCGESVRDGERRLSTNSYWWWQIAVLCSASSRVRHASGQRHTTVSGDSRQSITRARIARLHFLLETLRRDVTRMKFHLNHGMLAIVTTRRSLSSERLAPRDWGGGGGGGGLVTTHMLQLACIFTPTTSINTPTFGSKRWSGVNIS